MALEELRWGAFGDVIRQGETGQVNQLLDILRYKALTQMARESGGSATVRLNTLDWLGGQRREQADNEWHEAVNWLGDWCSEERHPVILVNHAGCRTLTGSYAPSLLCRTPL